MGHFNVLAETVDQAMQQAETCFEKLKAD